MNTEDVAVNVTDLTCRMKHCKDCGEWKPHAEFPLRSRGAGMGRASYCKPCNAQRVRLRLERQRGCMERLRRSNGAPSMPQRASHNRLPEDTARDYALNIFPLWPNVPKMVRALSDAAPKPMVPAIMRELAAMARAA